MISIIVPVYNIEVYIGQCIESVLHQTFRDIEVLLIDDGSTDRCGDICEEYARIDNRIRVFHTTNKGLSAARNLGVREARGEYIGFVDSDDWIDPDMYEILLRRLEETAADISVCEIWREYANGSKAGKCIQETVYTSIDAIRALILHKINDTVWNKLYKKRCWSEIEFPVGHIHEDIVTLYRVFQKASLVSHIPNRLYHYRMRNGSIMHNYSMERIKDNWNAYYSRYLSLSSIPEIKNDQECMNKLQEKLAEVITFLWPQWYRLSKEQRDYAFINMVSFFAYKLSSVLGKTDLSLILRAKLLLSRHNNYFSFIIFFLLRICYNITKTSKKYLNYS